MPQNSEIVISMETSEIKTRADEEIARINEIIKKAGVPECHKEALIPIIENTAWMKAKLDDAREAIKTAQIAITYNNGGGQKGIRENPLFKGYEALWKAYMAGMNRILDCFPDEALKAQYQSEEKQKTALDMVLERRRNKA